MRRRSCGDIGFEASRACRRPAIRWSSAMTAARRRRACRTSCSTATTTCSRPIRSSCGQTPPFEPRIATDKANGKVIVARGAEDNKGQLMTFLEAARAWKEVAGELPIAVIGADRRRGGVRLAVAAGLPGEARQGAARPISCSSATPASGTRTRRRSRPCCAASPAIEVVITGPSRDLHSGLYGGAGDEPDPRAGAHHRRHARRQRQGRASRASTTASTSRRPSSSSSGRRSASTAQAVPRRRRPERCRQARSATA